MQDSRLGNHSCDNTILALDVLVLLAEAVELCQSRVLREVNQFAAVLELVCTLGRYLASGYEMQVEMNNVRVSCLTATLRTFCATQLYYSAP